MAVGGIAGDLTFEEIGTNIEEQNDEIIALQAIFEGEDDRLVVLSYASDLAGGEDAALAEVTMDGNDGNAKAGNNMLQLFVPVSKGSGEKITMDVYLPWTEAEGEVASKPAGSKVTLSRSESGQRVIWTFKVTYLSPLCLHLTLPQSYPSQEPPSYVISCPWLSPGQLSAVCRELDRLWADNSGMPVLYTWFDWLQENILSFLGLDGQLSLTTHQLDEDIDDCRVLVESEDLNEIVSGLMRYDQQEEMKEFERTDHECGVCFDVQTGSKYFVIPQCKHPVCVACMKEHCQILVKDGSVLALGCPYYECKTSIPPYIIQQVLTEEQFQRYEKLALQKCLDVMGDIVWCPRCSNPVIVEESETDHDLAHCISCFYSFCAQCGEKWHPGEMCQVDAEALERLKEEMRKKKVKHEEERLEMIRRAKQLEEEGLSLSYISNNVSKCPSCRAKIMKTGGCNKVTCTNCHKCMCWTCQKPISGYDHFQDSRCNTFSTHEMFDNTDIRHPLQYGLYHNPPPPRPAPVLNQGRIIYNMIKANPELAKDVMVCSNCRQKVLRENNNNHLRCYNCKTSLCFDCKGKIIGPVGKHFSGVNTCRQHAYS